jgi:hypothetical protein
MRAKEGTQAKNLKAGISEENGLSAMNTQQNRFGFSLLFQDASSWDATRFQS